MAKNDKGGGNDSITPNRSAEERFIDKALRAVVRGTMAVWDRRLHDGAAAQQATYQAIMSAHGRDHVQGENLLAQYERARTDPCAVVLQQLAIITAQPIKLIERTPAGGYAPEPDRAGLIRMLEHLPAGAELAADEITAIFDKAVEELEAARVAAKEAYAATAEAEAQARAEEAKSKTKDKATKKKKRKKGKNNKSAPKKRNERRVDSLTDLGAAFGLGPEE